MRFWRTLDALQDFRKLDCEMDTLADLPGALDVGPAATQAIELAQQQVEVFGDQPMSEIRIGSRTGEIVVGDQGSLAHSLDLTGPPVRKAKRLRLSSG